MRVPLGCLSVLLLAAWLPGCGAPPATTTPAVAPRAAPAESPAREATGEPGQNPGFALDSDGRIALATLQRLDMVNGCEETAPGVLRVTLGKGWNRASGEYHLSHLYNGYAANLRADRPAVLELWKDGQKIGEYTTDGLLIGPEFSAPR